MYPEIGTVLFFLSAKDYEDDYEVDYCDHENTVYDKSDEDTCSHDDFDNLTPVNDISKYSNSDIFRPCCETHGYLITDSCKVYRFD